MLPTAMNAQGMRRSVTAWFRSLAMIACALPLFACSSVSDASNGGGDGSGAALTDVQLRALATVAAGWTWFNGNPDTLASTTGSGHVERRLRIRLNAKAATQLDASGRIRANASFPDSSLIVKELYSTTGQITTLAVMYRRPGDANLGANWLWGYFDGGGNVKIPVANRGAACVGCHSLGIDHTRANALQ